jgi:hypothetical protein
MIFVYFFGKIEKFVVYTTKPVIKMHDLYVCANECCRRYREDYRDAMDWLEEQGIVVEGIFVAKCGGRICNHCEYVMSWNIRECPKCNTLFGMSKPSKPRALVSLVPIPEPPTPIQSPPQSASQSTTQSALRIGPQPSPIMEESDDAEANPESRGDQFPQCVICEWYNPIGNSQCERCTAFLPEML